jgi:dynein heavy chain 2
LNSSFSIYDLSLKYVLSFVTVYFARILYYVNIISLIIYILGREGQSLDVVVFREVLDTVAYVDRALSAPHGSLLLAGRAGVGRKSAVRIVSALHGAKLLSLKMGKAYSLKNFKNDLKSVSC